MFKVQVPPRREPPSPLPLDKQNLRHGFDFDRCAITVTRRFDRCTIAVTRRSDGCAIALTRRSHENNSAFGRGDCVMQDIIDPYPVTRRRFNRCATLVTRRFDRYSIALTRCFDANKLRFRSRRLRHAEHHRPMSETQTRRYAKYMCTPRSLHNRETPAVYTIGPIRLHKVCIVTELTPPCARATRVQAAHA